MGSSILLRSGFLLSRVLRLLAGWRAFFFVARASARKDRIRRTRSPAHPSSMGCQYSRNAMAGIQSDMVIAMAEAAGFNV